MIRVTGIGGVFIKANDPAKLCAWYKTHLGIDVHVELGASASAVGWQARVNQVASATDATAPAAVFAVCCAVAKTFAAGVLGRPNALHEAWAFDLGDLSGLDSVPGQLDLGRVALLGAGAIGNGAAYVLDASGWDCDLTIIDHDIYEEPNEETSVLVSPTQACRGGEKANILAALTRRPGLAARGVVERVGTSSALLATAFDTFICAVDNPDTRRMLDGVRADLLLNAGVGGSRTDAGVLVWSRHRPGDPPLSARYGGGAAPQGASKAIGHPPRDLLDECSRIAYEDATLAAPFMGLAAGALLVAACASVGREAGPHDLRHLTFDLLNLQGAYRAKRRIC